MKTGFILIAITFILSVSLNAQRNCSTYTYNKESVMNNAALAANEKAIESFIQQQLSSRISAETINQGIESSIIKIPVVVHILYHFPEEKISDELVHQQIAVLNECFRRKNADSTNTPARFKSVAADCEIEFKLATSDPRKRNTTGIIKKYTPIIEWEAKDDMKFSTKMGDDAWNSKSYLNIWVCNLDNVAGYSSLPGGPADKDGIVIDFAAFGLNPNSSTYNLGKTAVHEVGHWLGLKHLWGDEFCGDDGIADTPKQSGYNVDCPTGVLISCNNGPNGDMYMNYMDFTSDACLNLFTIGQKARMQTMFSAGGPRNSILSSKGLDMPLIFESPLPEEDPRWLEVKLYPNPASNKLMLDLAYDIRWIGKIIQVTNLNGQVIMNVTVTSKNQQIDISKLAPGMYFLAAKKDDGESMKKRFIKL